MKKMSDNYFPYQYLLFALQIFYTKGCKFRVQNLNFEIYNLKKYLYLTLDIDKGCKI